ncbi:hypothetical protein E2C01_051806 [Portunus trituberculatus]|uniref:Uncharacterized protein n=1 Tax=Portunus trituberculatus TaxID=210409 RepID=A0A5B7GLG5_PORTR|nr:hypothetical protein [Portunus trituberculatus]
MKATHELKGVTRRSTNASLSALLSVFMRDFTSCITKRSFLGGKACKKTNRNLGLLTT